MDKVLPLGAIFERDGKKYEVVAYQGDGGCDKCELKHLTTAGSPPGPYPPCGCLYEIRFCDGDSRDDGISVMAKEVTDAHVDG